MKRWKWTRKRYERARRLARLFLRIRCRDKLPSIVSRYRELMQPLWDQDDKLDPETGGYYAHLSWRSQWFKRKKHGLDDDEIPF